MMPEIGDKVRVLWQDGWADAKVRVIEGRVVAQEGELFRVSVPMGITVLLAEEGLEVIE